MPNFHPHLVARVLPYLERDEEVWAVYAAERQRLIATQRHLFVLSEDGLESHVIAEFSAVRRAGDGLVLLERRSGSTIGLRVNPADEHGLQALTVIGLLIAADRAGLHAPPATNAPLASRAGATRTTRSVGTPAAGIRSGRWAPHQGGRSRSRQLVRHRHGHGHHWR